MCRRPDNQLPCLCPSRRHPTRGQRLSRPHRPLRSLRTSAFSALRGHCREAVGRQLHGRSRSGLLGVQPVVPVRPAAAATRRSPPRGRTRVRSGAARRFPWPTPSGSTRPWSRSARTRSADAGVPRPRRRRRAQLRGDAADGGSRRAGGPGAPRPQPQRAGAHRAAALDARRHRPPARRPPPALVRGALRAGRGGGRRRDARLHAHARGRADHVRPLTRPPTPGRWCATSTAWATCAAASTCCRWAPARWRARRCPSTARRSPRDLGFEAVSPNALDAVMDRDFAAEFVFACAQAPNAPVAPGRGPDLALRARVRLLHAARGLHHRLEPDAAEEEPGRAGAGARQGRRAWTATSCACSPDEVAARRLSEGHAGGQGSRLRRRRHGRALAAGDGRRRRRARPRPRGDARAPPAARR